MEHMNRRHLLQIISALGIGSFMPPAMAQENGGSASAFAELVAPDGIEQFAKQAGEALGFPNYATLEREIFGGRGIDSALSSIRVLVSEDFRDGRIVELAGWGVSQTEAKLLYLLGDADKG